MEGRIVVIEKNEQMRDLLTFCLESEGWQVFGYSYAQIDLAVVTQQRPDLIILDFSDPDGGAEWQFLQSLKMEDTTANTPVIITTLAFRLSEDIQGYLLTRYISVVYKPFDIDTFVTLVQQTVTQARQSGIIFSSESNLPILLVEDMEELRDAFTIVLTLEGYQVVTAQNGLVALDAASRADYCLILLDIAMPIMNGYEFLTAYDRQLRPHSPVIIISGEKDIRSRNLPSFVVDVLQKPFEFRNLLRLVSRYAQREIG